MNKKRIVFASIAGVVLVALIVVCVILLAHKNIEVSGTVTGTIGVDTIPVPENLGELEFVFPISYTDTASPNTGSGGFLKVKNGTTVTVAGEKEPISFTATITRYDAKSDYTLGPGLGVDIYTMDLPSTLEWTYADILSTVDWSDEEVTDVVESTYFCQQGDSCLGNCYVSEVRVHCVNSYNVDLYYVYSVGFSVVY